MHLILQSLTADIPALRRIAEHVAPRQMVELSPHALRCSGLTLTDPLQQKVNQLAWQQQVDVYWSHADKQLTDFKLLVMDMDSTLITIECIDEIADMHGLKPQVAAITEAAMHGEIEFTESLTRRVALLKGLPVAALQRVYDERVKLSPGAQTLLHAVQTHGLKTLLVSGGFTFFTDRLKAKLNLDYSHANQLEIINNQLTGKITGSIVDAEEKRRVVQRTCATLGISPNLAIIAGDGANDLAMMRIAGMSLAFHAKPVVREQAHVGLNFVGLDGLLNLF